MLPLDVTDEEGGDEPLAVGAFLDVLNESFVGMRLSLQGEVSGVEDRRNVIYFSLKDADGEAMLSCLIFRNDFLLQGVTLKEGQEIIVEGVPNVWKPRGRLSFRASVMRLAGMGALKRAYDELRLKLEREGIFLPEKKRAIPPFPRRVALITSREGAAIGDFTANLGRYGFSITLFDAHVEGKRSVGDILEGIAFFNQHPEDWDVLVIIRGGGSLESLEAFNSERVVRAIAESAIPTLAGIGHEKDVSLAALAADVMVSTPTATAKALSVSEEEAREKLVLFARSILENFQGGIFDVAERIREYSNTLRRASERVVAPIREIDRVGIRLSSTFSSWCERARTEQLHISRALLRFATVSAMQKRLDVVASRIEMGNPKHFLERGYSVLRKNGRVVRNVSDVAVGEVFEALLVDGSIEANVADIRRDKK
ncbi:MAG: exodeoxyribonuclease VII large subunit [Candidatus Moraniibacteriota bacterium]